MDAGVALLAIMFHLSCEISNCIYRAFMSASSCLKRKVLGN